MNEFLHNVGMVIGPMLQIVGGITVLLLFMVWINHLMTKP